jgi:hypothetical protein
LSSLEQFLSENRHPMKLDALNGLMELLDGDEDGRVTFEEFRKIFDEKDVFRTSQRVDKIEDVF